MTRNQQNHPQKQKLNRQQQEKSVGIERTAKTVQNWKLVAKITAGILLIVSTIFVTRVTKLANINKSKRGAQSLASVYASAMAASADLTEVTHLKSAIQILRDGVAGSVKSVFGEASATKLLDVVSSPSRKLARSA